MIRYDRELRRTWVLGLRFHHGMAGAMLAAAAGLVLRGFGRAALTSIGAGLMFHDWRDFPWTRDH